MKGDRILDRLEAHCVEQGTDSPEALLRKWYVDEGRTAEGIALKVDCSPTSIYNLLRRYGMVRRQERGSAWRKDMKRHFV